MEENPKLVEIFEESTFKKIFPKLFSSPISVTQLEKETGVSRTTIYKIFKTLDNIKTKNYVGIEGVLGKKDKFYYFKTEL
ncbi:MAG: helix-turn-helix domain-containing protein, partial [Candidatus Aenigmatarchaeota archaeon]